MSNATNDNPTLFVDLDGTLVATDTLWESIMRVMKNKPAAIPLMPLWVLKGKPYFKEQIAKRSDLTGGDLPYRDEVLQYLRAEKQAGRELVLATASHRSMANSVVNHFGEEGLFDQTIATDGPVNRSKEGKLESIREMIGPDAKFEYMGNSKDDLPIWKHADRCHVVDAPSSVLKEVQSTCNVGEVIQPKKSKAKSFIKAMRVHQWSKNALLLVPMLTSHSYSDSALWLPMFLALIAYSFAASSMYIFNDLLDLPSDRKHAKKCKRPFAAGNLSIPVGLFLATSLLIGSLAMAYLLLPINFFGLLLFYVCMTQLYSIDLKRRLLIDVIVLAAFYSLRVLAGAAAIEIEVTFWLLSFSMFLFFSLALVKRYTELLSYSNKETGKATGRGYNTGDIEIIRTVGIACGCMAVLVFALYIDGITNHAGKGEPNVYHYAEPKYLWMICPILFYGIIRIWFLAHRGQLDHDPVTFALKDIRSHILAVLIGIFLILAIKGGP